MNEEYNVKDFFETEEKPKKKKKKVLLIFVIICLLIAGAIIALMWFESQKEIERKKTYSETIKEIMNSAKTMVEEKTPESEERYNNVDTTYYISTRCIKGQEKTNSPFGDLDNAYVVTALEEEKNVYYFVGYDSKGYGFANMTSLEKINEDNIRSKIKEVNFDKGIGARTRVVIYDSNCKIKEQFSYKTGISKSEKADYDNKKAIKITAVRNIDQEYIVTNVGIYYSSNAGIGYFSDDSKNLMEDEYNDIKEKMIKDSSGNVGVRFAQNPTNIGEFSLIYSVIKETDRVYALPFVEANDKNGKKYIFYGPVYTTTYEEIISNN